MPHYYYATLNPNGLINIPKGIINKYQMKKGVSYKFSMFLREDGVVEMKPVEMVPVSVSLIKHEVDKS